MVKVNLVLNLKLSKVNLGFIFNVYMVKVNLDQNLKLRPQGGVWLFKNGKNHVGLKSYLNHCTLTWH